MTIAYVCVAIAAFMPFAFTIIAKAGDRSFDNSKPRSWLEQRGGYRQRAHWTQLNSFEAFPMFAAAVIIAQSSGVAQSTVNALAIAFIGCRVVYGALYLADKAPLRSVVWSLGMICVATLFVLAGVH